MDLQAILDEITALHTLIQQQQARIATLELVTLTNTQERNKHMSEKINSATVQDAIALINRNEEVINLGSTPASTIIELTDLLYALLNPDEMTYTMWINGTHFITTDTTDLVKFIKQYAKPQDHITIEIDDEDFDNIGTWKGIYQQGEAFLTANDEKCYGAGIKLEDILNDIAAKAEQPA